MKHFRKGFENTMGSIAALLVFGIIKNAYDLIMSEKNDVKKSPKEKED